MAPSPPDSLSHLRRSGHWAYTGWGRGAQGKVPGLGGREGARWHFLEEVAGKVSLEGQEGIYLLV